MSAGSPIDEAAFYVRGVHSIAQVNADAVPVTSQLLATTVRLRLQNVDPANEIIFTLDGTAPSTTVGWKVYPKQDTGFFAVKGGETLRLFAVAAVPTPVNIWQVRAV